MENLMINRVATDELAQLQVIGRQTFLEAFEADNSAENMAKYLDESFALEKLATEVGNPLSQFYFAVLDGEVIGYMKLNTGGAQTDIKDPVALEIERIYILQAFLGKKVGQLLYDKAIEVAMQMDFAYVWLGVWENNFRALSFYKKNGFVEFDKHLFMLGNDEQTDILMKKKLTDQ